MYLRLIAVVAASLLLLDLGSAAHGAQNLVYNGDFEIASTESPPPGWTMWGEGTWKIPANYTLDTVNPHSGSACFRIHHPAGTNVYVVSSPQHAIRPRKGMVYTVSFWARADKPGMSHFAFEAYSSIHPFIDAPSPGTFAIAAGERWERSRFTIEEGWDFFADRSRYLLLTFYATRDQRTERTLWVDDIVVTEGPSTRKGRLVDESALKYPPLQHRLRPGNVLDITVDAGKPLRRATQDVGGISFHRVCGWTGQPYDRKGDYTLAPELEQAIRDLHLPMTRFYAIGDEPFPVEESIDRAAEVCRRVGVPLDHVVLEFETQGATSKLPPELWARGVRHSVSKGYGFRYWEIANEPYLMPEGTAFPTPQSYIDHFIEVSRAIRAVQPSAQIGLAIDPESQTWGNAVLKQCAGHYDFVVGHYYSGIDRLQERALEVAVLAANYQKLDLILRTNALIRAYNPGRDVYQYDTEWGMISSGPHGEAADAFDRNANIVGTLHRAVRLIYYAREDILRGASGWEMLSRSEAQGFGILSPDAPDKRFMLYWLYYYFNRHLGEWALDMDGVAPYYTPSAADGLSDRPTDYAGPMTPALVTLSKDRKSLYLVVANGSWNRAAPCTVNVRTFDPVRAAGILLINDDLDGKPLLQRKEDAIAELPVTLAGPRVTCTIPAHSVVFLTLKSK